MGAKSESLTKRFEAKVQEAVAVIEVLSDSDWRKVTAAEKWTVGVTAHHLASALEPVAGIVAAVVSGQSLGNFTRAMLDEMNAKHAKEHANCTKAETIALLRKGAAAAAGVVRGLRDDQLAKSGTVFTDAPTMTAEQVITGGLITHIDEHFGSIRKTVDNPTGRKDAMHVEPYLFFEGRCEEAVEFYRKALGAEVTMLMRFKDSPEPPKPGMLPPGSENKVMHASLRIGDATVMASDGYCQGKPSFQGFSLSITVPDEARADELFAALANGGEAQMPLAKTFWSPRFGMVTDRFGVAWMINVPPRV